MANDTLTVNLIKQQSDVLLQKFTRGRYMEFVNRQYTPPVEISDMLVHHPEIKRLAHLCRALMRRWEKEQLIMDLITEFNNPVTMPTTEHKLQQAMARFYLLLQDTAGTMDAYVVVMTGWPLLHHIIKQYITETEQSITLDF